VCFYDLPGNGKAHPERQFAGGTWSFGLGKHIEYLITDGFGYADAAVFYFDNNMLRLFF